jgi:Domain of unknown function (DUF397)
MSASFMFADGAGAITVCDNNLDDFGLTTVDWCGYLGRIVALTNHRRAVVNGSQAGELAWHRGRQCDAGTCVEVAVQDEAVIVRSSNDPDGTWLRLSRDEWTAFLTSAKDGMFDVV